MRKLKRAAMDFQRTKLNLDTVDLDTMDLDTTMINVEGDVKALEGDMIIEMMDLITWVIIWHLHMHTYTAKDTIMNIMGEAIVYTKYTVDRYRGEWVDLLIDLTRVAGKGQQTRG